MQGDGYKSRKFTTMIGCIVLFTALLFVGRITEQVYENLMYLSLGGYFVANVGEKWVRK